MMEIISLNFKNGHVTKSKTLNQSLNKHKGVKAAGSFPKVRVKLICSELKLLHIRNKP